MSTREATPVTELAGWRGFRARFVRHRAGVLGVAMLGVFLLMAVAHPILMATVWPISIYDPIHGNDVIVTPLEIVPDGEVTDPETQIELSRSRIQNPFYEVGDTYNLVTQPEPFTLRHPLGVDNLGRDVLSMTLAATAPSFVVGMTAAITTAVVGTSAATAAAFFRRRTDATISQVSNAFMVLPAPLVLIILGAGPFGDQLTPFRFGLIYGFLAGLGATAIIVRTRALTVMSAPFMDAARVAGGGSRHLITHHLFPHLVPVAALTVLVGVSGAIIADGFVSFLGYTDTRLNWGSIVFWAMSLPPANRAGIPWEALLAGAGCIAFFSGAWYLVGMGIRDAADPFARR
jgi:peptide/nickel transport system permease protein